MMFYYLDTYIFYISDHKLGTCSTILKDHRKGRCIMRVIMSGLFRLSVVAGITKIMHGPFFFAHQFSLVFVYLMCGPRQLFFQRGRDTPKDWTPLVCVIYSPGTSLTRPECAVRCPAPHAPETRWPAAGWTRDLALWRIKPRWAVPQWELLQCPPAVPPATESLLIPSPPPQQQLGARYPTSG